MNKKFPKDNNPLTPIYGINPILEFLNSDLEKGESQLFIHKINEVSPGVEKIIKLSKKLSVQFRFVERDFFHKVLVNHQGVCLDIPRQNFYKSADIIDDMVLNSEGVPLCFLMLDGITDVRNFGSIIRSAAAMNVSAIITPENNSAPINDGSIRTSTGGVFHIPIIQANNIKDIIYLLQSLDFEVISCTERGKNSLGATPFHYRTVFLLGSEEKGINPSLIKLSDKTVKIPLSDKISSLNVSVSAGIFMQDFNRQHFIK